MTATWPTHHFETYEAANEFINSFEKENNCHYVKRNTRNHTVERISCLEQCAVRFEEKNGELPIDYDGIPFVILGTEVRECQYGQDRSMPQTKNGDHHYVEMTKRIAPNSKKQGCTALIRMRMLIKFPEFQIKGNGSSWRRRIISKKLKESFNPITTKQQYHIVVRIEDNHTAHLQGELSDFRKPLDKRVITQIRTLVEAGCDSVEEIQKELDIFVKTDLGITEDITSGKRFFAKPQDIRNHVHIAMKSLVCKKQAAIHDKLEKVTDLAAVVTDLNLLNNVSSSLDECIEIMEQSVNLKNAKRAQEGECVAVKKFRKIQLVKSKSGQNRPLKTEKTQKAKKVSHVNGESQVTDYPIVLTEFSSIVTDTQHYIMPAPELINNSLGQQEQEQATEYILVSDLMDQENHPSQNMEIASSTDGSHFIEGTPNSDKYILITEPGTEHRSKIELEHRVFDSN